MAASKLDAVYRSILLTKFFTKGWGKPENLRRLFEFRKVVSNRDECLKLIEPDYPVTITKEQTLSDCKLLEGYFMSPLERHLPGIVPEIAQKAHFQVLMPVHWPEPGVKPMCLHLAGTGDHFFWRRRNLMVKPLLKEAGIGGIILENPFYGLRKPTDQVRSSLHNVSDIFVMGGCLILESLVLFHWCERNGLGPLGVTGLSMGGHGVMSHSINWDLLEDQYLSDGQYREKLSKMVTIVDEAFLAGKKFARTYSQNMEKTKTEPPTKNPLETDTRNPKHSKTKTNQMAEVTRKAIEVTTVPRAPKAENVVHIEKYSKELKQLLDQGKITQVLYNKLTSKNKFELDLHDIEIMNKINEGELKEILLKCKVVDVRNTTLCIEKSEKSTPTSINAQGDVITEIPPKDSETLKSAETEDREKLKLTKIYKKEKLKTTDIEDKQVSSRKRPWNVDWTNIPLLRSGKSEAKRIDITKIHWRDRETLQFMRGIMDECTHLSNFSVPYDTSLIIAVCAKRDAYVPRDDVGTLEEIWPGAEVRYVDAGHVSAYILHQSLFRACIKEAFERSKKKWKAQKQ